MHGETHRNLITLTLQASSLLAKHIASRKGGEGVRWTPPQDFLYVRTD